MNPHTIDAHGGARLLDLDRDDLVAPLATHGAVVLRGFHHDDGDFAALTRRFGTRTTCDPTKITAGGVAGGQGRLGRGVRAARRAVARLVPSAASASRPDRPRVAPFGGSGINPHTENAYLPDIVPDLVWFHCVRPAADGGTSLLSDGRELLERLDADLLRRVRDTPLRYDTRLTRAQWTAAYDTHDRDELVQRLDAVDRLAYRFDEQSTLHLDYTTPQVGRTRLGDGEALQTNLLSQRPFRRVGTETYVDADRRPLDPDLVQGVLDAAFDGVAEVDLDAGDVLVIDNTRVMHGRSPFTDRARRVLTLCTWLDDEPGTAA